MKIIASFSAKFFPYFPSLPISISRFQAAVKKSLQYTYRFEYVCVKVKRAKSSRKNTRTHLSRDVCIFFSPIFLHVFLATTLPLFLPLQQYTFTFLRRIKLRGGAEWHKFYKQDFPPKKRNGGLEKRPSPISHT